MTPTQLPLPPLLPVSDLVHRVLGAAAHGISEGSRRNARAALEARYDLARQSAEILTAFPRQPRHRVPVRHRATG